MSTDPHALPTDYDETGWREVRECFADSVETSGGTVAWANSLFDAMLARVRAEAWAEGFAAGHDAGVLDEDRPANPYRVQP